MGAFGEGPPPPRAPAGFRAISAPGLGSPATTAGRGMLDLIIKGGRVIDPANGRDEVTDIGFDDGKVVAVGSGMPFVPIRRSMHAASSSCPA